MKNLHRTLLIVLTAACLNCIGLKANYYESLYQDNGTVCHKGICYECNGTSVCTNGTCYCDDENGLRKLFTIPKNPITGPTQVVMGGVGQQTNVFHNHNNTSAKPCSLTQGIIILSNPDIFSQNQIAFAKRLAIVAGIAVFAAAVIDAAYERYTEYVSKKEKNEDDINDKQSSQQSTDD